MKRNASISLICLAVLLLLPGCYNFLSRPLPNSGMHGNVTVYFGTGAGRAALSPTAMNFDSVAFSFRKVGNELADPAIRRTAAEGFSFYLEQNEYYTLQVNAYSGAGADERLAATGAVTTPFLVSSSTSVSVDLKGILTGGGTGTFSWEISHPAHTLIEEMLLYNGINDIPLNYMYDGSALTSGSAPDIPAGRYFFIVRLNRLNGDGFLNGDRFLYDESAGYVNGVEIFPGQVTVFHWDFTDELKDLNIENSEIRIDDWFGFNIKGEGSYDPGYSEGFLIKSFKHPDAGTHRDVLKLLPPPGGYAMDSTSLTYKVPVDGYYELSIDVFVEKNIPDNNPAYIYFEKTDWAWDCIAGNRAAGSGLPFGKWTTVKTPVSGSHSNIKLYEGDRFGLIAKDSTVIGLNSHTIYFKNPRVKVIGFSNEYNYMLVGDNAGKALHLSPERFTLYKYTSEQLVVSGNISGGRPVWTSSDPAIATVDQKGVITGHKKGTVIITVKSGSLSATSEVKVSPKYIALTFDDGPDPGAGTTETLLNVLNNKGAKATFFLVGMCAEYNETSKNLVRRMAAEGHDIGSHTWDHSPIHFTYDIYNPNTGFTEKSVAFYKKNLFDTQKTIWEITGGYAPLFFRPPYLGYNNQSVIQAARELGLPRVAGDLLGDWVPGASPQAIVKAAMDVAKPWSILIFHDYYRNGPLYEGPGTEGNGQNTVAAIPDIIDQLMAQGYEPVSLSKMLAERRTSLMATDRMYYSLDMANTIPSPFVPVANLSVDKTTVTLKNNTSTTVKATVSPINATERDVYWYSSNDSIATVNGNGVITAKTVGSTKIYAMAEGKLVEVIVTVNP